MKIYYIKYDDIILNYLYLLNKNDYNHIKSFSRITKQKKIMGILLQKVVIKQFYNISTKSINILRINGKPYYNNLTYSISYTDDYVILVLSNNIVGIDIESNCNKNNNLLKKILNKHVVNEREIKNNSLDQNLLLWTKIESYLKLIGRGLIDLCQIELVNGKIMDNRNLITFRQKNISDKLPNNTLGTVSYIENIKKIYFYEINLNMLINILNN